MQVAEVNVNRSQEPLVSILTPVYNMGKFLPECIESVLCQTYGNFEYIILNNCSTDNTLEIALEYAKKDSRIRVHNSEKFVGVIENHNNAFRLISPDAKYCKVVSADDYIFPECISRMVELAEANPSVGLVGSYSIAGRKVLYSGLEYEKKVVSGREISRATLLGGPYIFGTPTSLMYRADLARNSAAFYPYSDPHSDTTACYQAMEQSDFGFVHQVLSYTRVHAESQTSRSIKYGVIKFAMLRDVALFAPKYLTETEVKTRLELATDAYYGALVSPFIEKPGNKEFWDKQRTQLREIGLEFNFSKVLVAAAARGLKLFLNPVRVIRKVTGIRKNTGRIEAQYYDGERAES
jgi:glycosyltransferase involved in cell wall biosynthesis